MKLAEIEVGNRYTYYLHDEQRHLRHYPELVEKKNKKSIVVKIFDALNPKGRKERVKPAAISSFAYKIAGKYWYRDIEIVLK